MLQAILAMASDGVIGSGNTLPWAIPEDMRHFKSLTMGHAIIMGRKTHESIGKSLPGRRNIVVSNSEKFFAGMERASSPKEAVEMAFTSDPNPFVIGGAQIYRALWPSIWKVYLTEVHNTYPDADVRVPQPEKLFDGFRELERTPHSGFSFVTWERP